MLTRHLPVVLIALLGCGDGGGTNPDGGGGSGGDGGGGDGGGGGGLALLYAGPVAGAVVPDWSAAAPRPLLLEARLGSTWWVAIARIAPGGQVSEVVADELRIWGWPAGATGAPAELASGPLATTRVPGWSQTAPRPLVLGARQNGSQDWFAAVAKVHPDGALSELVVDTVTIWGWAPATGPDREYAGPLGGIVSPWSASSPRPLIVLANQSQPEWYVSLIGIDAGGAVGGIVADRVELWGF